MELPEFNLPLRIVNHADATPKQLCKFVFTNS